MRHARRASDASRQSKLVSGSSRVYSWTETEHTKPPDLQATPLVPQHVPRASSPPKCSTDYAAENI